MVTEWRAGQATIAAGCQALSEVLLLAVEGKRVYAEGAFLQHQTEHIMQVRASSFAQHWVNGTVIWTHCKKISKKWGHTITVTGKIEAFQQRRLGIDTYIDSQESQTNDRKLPAPWKIIASLESV